MSKYEIWFSDDREEFGLFIPTNEIEQKICTYGEVVIYRLKKTSTDERITELNVALEQYMKENKFNWHNSLDVGEFFEENEIEYDIHVYDYYAPNGRIVFCEGEFFNEDDLDTSPVYTWWDGHNYVDIDRPEGYVVEVEYNEKDEECLDEWNGHNYQSGGVGLHDYVVHLGDNRNLMIRRSQWEGEHTTAHIWNDAQYAQYRKDNHLD